MAARAAPACSLLGGGVTDDTLPRIASFLPSVRGLLSLQLACPRFAAKVIAAAPQPWTHLQLNPSVLYTQGALDGLPGWPPPAEGLSGPPCWAASPRCQGRPPKAPKTIYLSLSNSVAAVQWPPYVMVHPKFTLR